MYTLRYKKSFKIKKIKKSSKYLGVVIFGAFGLKTVLSCVLRATHLESMRRTVARITKRVSLVWIRVFFIQSLTKKPLGSRMGKGSGVIKTWVSYIKSGVIILEVGGIKKNIGVKALSVASLFLPCKVTIVSRNFTLA